MILALCGVLQSCLTVITATPPPKNGIFHDIATCIHQTSPSRTSNKANTSAWGLLVSSKACTQVPQAFPRQKLESIHVPLAPRFPTVWGNYTNRWRTDPAARAPSALHHPVRYLDPWVGGQYPQRGIYVKTPGSISMPPSTPLK